MPRDLSSIHPELVTMAKLLPNFRYDRGTLPFIRLFFGLVYPFSRAHRSLSIQTRWVQSGDTKTRVRLRVYRPRQAPGPVPALVWFHGGGHVVGNLNMSDERLLAYAQELGIAVVSVDYRLAPEHPFPADLDDAFAALKWVRDQAGELGVAPDRIGVGGESAGGGLAAALAQRCRDRGDVKPAFQLLVYPMLDDRTGSKPEETETEFLVWTPESNRFSWDAYLQRSPGSDEVPAGSVPARRADLRGLPPAWIGVGTADLFYEEDAAYAGRLQACGVDCELVIVPGAFHGFDGAGPQLPMSRDFQRSQVEALRKHLFPTALSGIPSNSCDPIPSISSQSASGKPGAIHREKARLKMTP